MAVETSEKRWRGRPQRTGARGAAPKRKGPAGQKRARASMGTSDPGATQGRPKQPRGGPSGAKGRSIRHRDGSRGARVVHRGARDKGPHRPLEGGPLEGAARGGFPRAGGGGCSAVHSMTRTAMGPEQARRLPRLLLGVQRHRLCSLKAFLRATRSGPRPRCALACTM